VLVIVVALVVGRLGTEYDDEAPAERATTTTTISAAAR